MTKNGSKYGCEIGEITGYKAVLKKSKYHHIFGGNPLFKIIPDGKKLPTQIAVLDLSDPIFNYLKIKSNSQKLPLFFYLDTELCDLNLSYYINENLNNIAFNIDDHLVDASFPDYLLPNPLEEKSISFVPLADNEIVSTEENYWNACDSFCGGDSFFRLFQPLWMQDLEIINCCCHEMIFISCIGYQNFKKYKQYINNNPFFAGEFAMYFFYCNNCYKVEVKTQSV